MSDSKLVRLREEMVKAMENGRRLHATGNAPIGSYWLGCAETLETAIAKLDKLRAEQPSAFDPIHSPGHTDLMIPPEAIDKLLAEPEPQQPAEAKRSSKYSMIQCNYDSVDFPREVTEALDELDDRLSLLEREAGERDMQKPTHAAELFAAVREALVGFRPDERGMGSDWFQMPRSHCMKLLRLVTVDAPKPAPPSDLTDAECEVVQWVADTVGLSKDNESELARRVVGLRGKP